MTDDQRNHYRTLVEQYKQQLRMLDPSADLEIQTVKREIERAYRQYEILVAIRNCQRKLDSGTEKQRIAAEKKLQKL